MYSNNLITNSSRYIIIDVKYYTLTFVYTDDDTGIKTHWYLQKSVKCKAMDQNNTVHCNSMYVWITVLIVYILASNLG
jgi:hypothetical protein